MSTDGSGFSDVGIHGSVVVAAALELRDWVVRAVDGDEDDDVDDDVGGELVVVRALDVGEVFGAAVAVPEPLPAVEQPATASRATLAAQAGPR